MYLCYVDESGGFEAPNSSSSATPLMVIAGLIVPAAAISPLTSDLLYLNRRFFPNKASQRLDFLLKEMKGSGLRAQARSSSRRVRRHATQVLDGVMSLVEKHDLRLLGRIWIKEPTEGLQPRETYTFSIQDIAMHFNRFLEEKDSQGLILCDSRRHNQDVEVAHSVFTQKHKVSGDEFPRLVEPVVFGRSENHAGLQMADILASSLLFPIAARVYCAQQGGGVHADPHFDDLRSRYSSRLRARRYLYRDADGTPRGGVVVSDRLNKRHSGLLFRPAP